MLDYKMRGFTARVLAAALVGVLGVGTLSYKVDVGKCAKKIGSDDCFLEGTQDGVSALCSR